MEGGKICGKGWEGNNEDGEEMREERIGMGQRKRKQVVKGKCVTRRNGQRVKEETLC